MSERNELKILNRVVGSSTGWDECEYLSLQFYDFVPANGFDMPAGTLYVDFEKGIFETYGDDDVIASKDMLIVMNGLAAVQFRASNKS